ncbi:unnamed protein product [Schistosoma curassoni]|uniref:PITH domain-containing protein n=1 Tax=Schistosoma curassoni TaxID=6186 RepID=A0A183JYB8_9TREM|nr:unnamed protein product [Schistosoma curassoni]
MLPDEFDPVSSNFTVKDVATDLSEPKCLIHYSLINRSMVGGRD